MSAFRNFFTNVIRTEAGDLFPYYTVKVAKIRDWRLGFFYYTVFLVTIAYIIWNLIRNNGYMKLSNPIAGSVRTSLQLTTVTNGIEPVPPYCGATLPAGYEGCLYLTPEQAVFPYQGQLATMFITTRVRVKTFASKNDAKGKLCNYELPTSAECFPPQFSEKVGVVSDMFYYVANVEQMTIQIEHAVRAQYLMGFLGTTFQLWEGLQLDGSMIRACNADKSAFLFSTAQDRKPDQITVGDLIANAGCEGDVSLDGISTAQAANQSAGETWRGSGMVISMPIVYRNNYIGEGGSAIKYAYVPAVLPNTECKTTEKIYNADGTLSYYDRHGIQIVFAQSGQLGQFDVQSLLVSIVGGLALISLARLIVDFFMIFVVKKREMFSRMKYEMHGGEDATHPFGGAGGASTFSGPSDPIRPTSSYGYAPTSSAYPPS